MTIKETLCAIADASDKGLPKIAIFQPAITNATRKKNGDTTITLKLVTNEFTPEDVLKGMIAWLAIGTVETVRALNGDATK
jgi:hypothetical protein